MRAVSIFLLTLVAVATVNALATAFYPPYKGALRDLRSKAFPEFSHVENAESTKTAPASGARPGDAELAASIDRMAAGIDALVATSGTGTVPPVRTGTGTSGTGSAAPAASSGAVAPKPQEVEPEYPLPGILLARLMPDVFPKKVENKGIFDIHIFRGIGYSTYADEKTKAKFYAFSESYGVMLSNLKLVSPVYGIRETDTFFSETFFLNPTNKKDTTVRFVTELEGKAVGVEIPKAAYSKLKKLLLQQ